MRVLEGITVAQVLVPCAPVPVGTAVGQVPDTVRAVLGRPGVPVVVDPSSAQLLSGATLDYKDGLQGAGFAIDNPNAQRTCGCGNSFS